MIYDCFTFFNELDLLEIRLHELEPVVDRFVLVEGTRTFQGKPKALCYQENKNRFKDFWDKIIHIVVDKYPRNLLRNPWTFEHHQRNMIMEGLTGCGPDDVVIVSDVDEIPKAEKVGHYKNVPGYKIFKQRMFYYFLNCLNDTNISPSLKFEWYGSVMCDFQDLRRPTKVRDFAFLLMMRRNSSDPLRRGVLNIVLKFMLPRKEIVFIEDGGWHFSFLGGVEQIIQKVEAFSHKGYNKESFKDRDRIQQAINSGKDIFGRRYNYTFVEIDASYPVHVLNNVSRFGHLISR